MTKCRRSCRHRSFVSEYSAARAADVGRRDEAVGVYGPDSPEFTEYQPPPITFQRWLQQMAGWGTEETPK
jgi:hypothetical protein